MKNDIAAPNCILIVDDDFINRELLKNIFSHQYEFEEASNGREGLEQIHRHMNKLCAIILDVQMPEMNGLELLQVISMQGVTEKIPTFLITAQDDEELMNEAYHLGVMDVVTKPVSPIVVQKRVRTVIELFSARAALSATVDDQERKLTESARQIDDLHRGTIETLATAIEFRDVESGQHTSRIYGMTKYVLTHTDFGKGLSADTIENIARGSIMHDVGKIAISDVILNKPGKLTNEEYEIMKQHTTKGAELLEQVCRTQAHESYRYAKEIAHHHHERWDGRGYPEGLKGDQISIAAQVVSIVDVYDALVSVRVYRKPYSSDEAVQMIREGKCGAFNPHLVECFVQAEPAIRQWYISDAPEEPVQVIARDNERANTLYSQAATVEQEAETPSAVRDVMLLMTAMQTAYDMIISVNLTRNTYYMIDYDRFATHCADNMGVFDDLIEYGSASIPVSHRQEFHDTFCRENQLKAFQEGKKTISLEHPQYSDDGKLHWVATKVLLMEDARTGELLQITLSQYIDQEYAEREKTRKILTEALHLAEHANNAKYDFLSKMSHDVRTPLNAIIGMTTIIAANLDHPEKINDCLIKISTSSRYLLGIMNDVLDYSKIENGSMSLHLSEFNLREMITEISTDMSEKATAKGQTMNLHVKDEVGSSYIGDEFRIRQVLLNLLDNAYRYTKAGSDFGLTISVQRHTAEYDVLAFEVKDAGIGIRPEFMPQLFEPFAQDEGSDTVDSIGLGLPIALNLAHLMNGDIDVQSEPGKGSTFTFELPLERGSTVDESQELNTDLKVLVVDDDVTVCEHASVLLHNMGLEAKIVDNGYDAVKMVEACQGTENAFDVAIIDWQMPEMDGVETVRRIRHVVGKDVLVVVMSAYDWTSIEEEARLAGVDLFLAKPISENNLRMAIACSGKMIREQQDITFQGEKVLVAEDNEFNAEIAKTILEMKNLRVELACDGKAAYEKFTASAPGEYLAIFMDILMPVMDGHEATRAIRASEHPEAETIPIYAMTANAFHTDILEAKLAGMNGHIAKPVDFDEVARVLQTITRKHKKEKISIGGGSGHGKL